jgi:protein-tyrosine phosphatase
MTKILMVCTANICRSPMAMTVATTMAKEHRLTRRIRFDSAGTHAPRMRQKADARAIASLVLRGYPPGRNRSRRIELRDFNDFDLVLAMDSDNLSTLRKICPTEHVHKLRLFLSFSPTLGVTEVADPYFGDLAGFERALDLCEAGVHGLIHHYSTP